jgi:xanthosine utilization system XapX-like protein
MKSYIEGGTTPDSKIVINKPKPNYTKIGIIGLIGVYVIYKVVFNKKSK